MSLFVDTSVSSLALRRDRPPDVPEVGALERALAAGDLVMTMGLVYQELLRGFHGPRDHEAIVAHFGALPFLTPDRHDHFEAAQIRNRARPLRGPGRHHRRHPGPALHPLRAPTAHHRRELRADRRARASGALDSVTGSGRDSRASFAGERFVAEGHFANPRPSGSELNGPVGNPLPIRLDRSRKFYEGVLGLHSIPRLDLGAMRGFWYAAGACEAHLIETPAGLDVGNAPPQLNPIARHSAFAIENYDEVLSNLQAHGLEIVENRRSGQMWVCDPDGVISSS